MTTKKSNNKVPLIPPTGFTYIEDVICRCIGPLHRNHLSFLRTTDVKILINVSNEPIYDIEYLIEKENYQVYDLFDNEQPINHSINGLEDWVKKSLELILTLSYQGTILLIGNDDTCFDCLLIGCLRKVQEWTLVPILNEFRMLSNQKRIFDLEQFIELFNSDIINFTSDIPEFLVTHFLLKEEEQKLLERVHNDSNINQDNEIRLSSNDNNDNDDNQLSEQHQIDQLFLKLFFSNMQSTISHGVKYDPNITLIQDKDDDD